MTVNDSIQHEQENPYYIPPAAGPSATVPKNPEKKSGNDWLGFVYIIISLFVLIAAFQLYFVIQELIRTWISDQFVRFGRLLSCRHRCGCLAAQGLYPETVIFFMALVFNPGSRELLQLLRFAPRYSACPGHWPGELHQRLPRLRHR